MDTVMRIKADNKKEARKKAISRIQEENSKNIEEKDIKVELEETKKKFFGLGKTIKIYKILLAEARKKENEISEIADNIEVDGDFKIKVRDEGIFVKVIPPQGQGKKVQYQFIKNKLDQKEIVEIDWETLQEEVNDPSEEWIKIAPRKPELDRDYEINVHIGEDKLKAFIDYYPALGGEKVTLDKLYNILKENGITYGIKTDRLKQIVKYNDSEENVLIAEGDPPVPGEDAELIYHFEEKEKSVGTKRADGSIDFFDLGLINNVEPGDVLVTLKDSQPGESGKTITGEEIPPPSPEEKSLPGGKNTEPKDENTLVSKISGQVVKEGKKVKVLPIHEVNGNVDLSTGNIDFNGNVVIKGDVKEGFEVIAEGNIEIKGNVSAAKIHSKSGEVVIHKGFIGKEKGRLEARGDIKVKFAENARIKTDEDIIVADAVMHSDLIAGKKIIVIKNKGLIVGGRCRAGHEIKANILGSNFATKTILEAGINPEIKSRLHEIEEELERLEKNLYKSEKALKLLEEKKRELGKLPPDNETAYQQVKTTKNRLEERIDDHKREYNELEKKVAKLNQGQITVNKKVNPGVQLYIGKSCLNVKNELRKGIFEEIEGEVKKREL